MASSKISPFQLLPSECLLQIFGPELDLITTSRERLNDLFALSLVCRAFRGPAQACLFGDAFIRAPGRATLLLEAISRQPRLAGYLGTLSWCTQTKRAGCDVLAQLIRTAPSLTGLAVGSGFFEGAADPAPLSGALDLIADRLTHFAFGGFELTPTSSDYVSHLLSGSGAFRHLTSLELHQVCWASPFGNAGTLSNAFWLHYPRPTFRLKRVVVSWPQPRSAATAWSPDVGNRREEDSWLYWLLASSVDTLRSVMFKGLADDMPQDALELLKAASRNLLDLQITDYQGAELLGDTLAEHAHQLLSLTVGSRFGELLDPRATPDVSGMPVFTPVLATPTLLRNRKELRCLEVHGLPLFERLELRKAIEAGQLPKLRQIVLVSASRVHDEVQRLDKACAKRDIILRVKR